MGAERVQTFKRRRSRRQEVPVDLGCPIRGAGRYLPSESDTHQAATRSWPASRSMPALLLGAEVRPTPLAAVTSALIAGISDLRQDGATMSR